MKIVECPVCGRQYLPSEIFFPSCVFGGPSYIERDDAGKIVHVIGTDMILFERYDCDNCNSTFEVSIDIKFSSKVPPHINFIEEF